MITFYLSHLELWKEVNGEQSYLKDAYPNSTYDVPIISDVGKVCVYLISTENTLNSLIEKILCFLIRFVFLNHH